MTSVHSDLMRMAHSIGMNSRRWGDQTDTFGAVYEMKARGYLYYIVYFYRTSSFQLIIWCSARRSDLQIYLQSASLQAELLEDQDM